MDESKIHRTIIHSTLDRSLHKGIPLDNPQFKLVKRSNTLACANVYKDHLVLEIGRGHKDLIGIWVM